MGKSSGEEHFCPQCGPVLLEFRGIRAPSATKHSGTSRTVEVDYIVVCPKCGYRQVLPELPRYVKLRA